jgi:hypothetical protein
MVGVADYLMIYPKQTYELIWSFAPGFWAARLLKPGELASKWRKPSLSTQLKSLPVYRCQRYGCSLRSLFGEFSTERLQEETTVASIGVRTNRRDKVIKVGAQVHYQNVSLVSE